MKKTIKILNFVFILILLTTITSCKKKKAVESSFPEIVNQLTSYKLVGRLESNFPSGMKESNITTYYRSPGEYRVEIQNPNVNETQIMVKNNEGVYVLIPSIHKTFKVNSTWPSNMSYPYLLQSLSNDIVSEENIITTKEGNNTVLELKAKLFNEDETTTQKIIFDENKMPKEVLLYDGSKNLLSRFIIETIEKNIELSNELFNVSESLQTLYVYYQANPMEFERTLTYPTYFPEGSHLKEEKITGSSINRFALMKFSGSTNYTIVQKFVNLSSDEVVEYVNGNIYIMGGVFSFINDNNIQFYENGVEYMIASNEISCLEMIKMGDSLRYTESK